MDILVLIDIRLRLISTADSGIITAGVVLLMSMQYEVAFPSGKVQYLFGKGLQAIEPLAPQPVILTDSHVASLYPSLTEAYPSIIIPAGESYKTLETLESITGQLLQYQVQRKSVLVGVGGGVVTDIAGFAAAVYMRGINCGFVPTTLLAMVDAAIGGKNGVDFGLQKNLVGTIRQPQFILFDTTFLQTLPEIEWSNGFAEVIKYACIFDAPLFDELAVNHMAYYQQQQTALKELIQCCATWKNQTVQEDEHESGARKLLNFGHTVGHAIETLYQLPHGQAVALGMLVACKVSETVTQLDGHVYHRLTTVLQQYKLPYSLTLHPDRLMDILAMDKKRNDDKIDFIVLKNIGHAAIETIGFDVVRKAIDNFSYAGNR